MATLSRNSVSEPKKIKTGIQLVTLSSVKCVSEYETKKKEKLPAILYTFKGVPKKDDPDDRTLVHTVMQFKKFLPLDLKVKDKADAWERFTNHNLHIAEAFGGSLAEYSDEELSFDDYNQFIEFFDKHMNGVEKTDKDGNTLPKQPLFLNEDGTSKMVWLVVTYEGAYLNVPTFPNFIEPYISGKDSDLVWKTNYSHVPEKVNVAKNSDIDTSDMPTVGNLNDLP